VISALKAAVVEWKSAWSKCIIWCQDVVVLFRLTCSINHEQTMHQNKPTLSGRDLVAKYDKIEQKERKMAQV